MRNKLKTLYWYHITRLVALLLIFYAVGIEDDPGNRGTCITAAIGLLAAEPVGRREKAAPPDQQRRQGDPNKDDRTG